MYVFNVAYTDIRKATKPYFNTINARSNENWEGGGGLNQPNISGPIFNSYIKVSSDKKREV